MKYSKEKTEIKTLDASTRVQDPLSYLLFLTLNFSKKLRESKLVCHALVFSLLEEKIDEPRSLIFVMHVFKYMLISLLVQFNFVLYNKPNE